MKCDICNKKHEGIGGYYDRKRCEQYYYSEEIKRVKRDDPTNCQLIKELEYKLEMARYVGD